MTTPDLAAAFRAATGRDLIQPPTRVISDLEQRAIDAHEDEAADRYWQRVWGMTA